MANPNPETDHLKGSQYRESILGGLGPTRGIRFPKDIDEILIRLPAGERSALVRTAVRAYLNEQAKYIAGQNDGRQ